MDVSDYQRMQSTLLRDMLEHAERESPRECCGLLAGDDGIIDRHYPLPNVSAEPCRRYFAELRALLGALQDIRARAAELLGIYHSHPHSAPEPSPADIEQAFYPECVYFIIGPRKIHPCLRAFRLVEGRFESITILWIER